jgi:hypothetical protein
MKPRMKFRVGKWGGALVALTLVLTVGCAQKDGFYSNTLRSDVFVQLYDIHKYDFLWVVDNSGSMTDKRNYVRDNMQNFITIMNSRKAVDYQMAVTTSDYFTTAGNLVQSTGGLKVVKSATSTNPAGDFASILNQVTDTGTSFWEQGMVAMWKAINTQGSQFIRSGVPLVVIIISDDDDWSCKQMANGSPSCFGIQPEDNPNVILYDTSFFGNFLTQLKAPENVDTTLFAINGKTDSTCSVERVGSRYSNLVNQVGGLSSQGGICLDVLPQTLNNIAQTIADRGIRFPLSNQSNGQNITVYVNGNVISYSQDNGYYYDAATNSIIFTGDAIPTNGDLVQVTYSQESK